MKLANYRNRLLRAAVALIGCSVAPAAATDFVNGGFETGTFAGWTLEYGTWSGGAWVWGAVLPGGHPPPAVIDSTSAMAPGQIIDVDPICGDYAARINDGVGQFHATRLKQTVLAEEDCPAGQLYFVWRAILADGGHIPGQQSELRVRALINGAPVASTQLDATAAATFGSGWTALGGGVYTRMQPVALALPAIVIGDAIEVQIEAYDCLGGGHGGMAFLDCVTLTCPALQPYCTPGTSSNGCTPSLDGTGVASASAANGFTLNVSNLEGLKAGLFFYGVSGAMAAPWGPGSTSFLCVKAPVQRIGLQNSGGSPNQCNGSMSVDWNAYVASTPGALGSPFSPGDHVWAQAWYRDPMAAKTTNLTGGLRFTVAP